MKFPHRLAIRDRFAKQSDSAARDAKHMRCYLYKPVRAGSISMTIRWIFPFKYVDFQCVIF